MVERTLFCQGRYQVIRELGRSHYATVYEARDNKTDDCVAVKVLCLSGTHRNIAEAMFRKEVGALTGLKHPAVVGLISHFSEPERDQVGIVLELVRGGRTLEQMVSDVRSGNERRKSLHWRSEQLLALLEGLDSAHASHVIHRDVKLANVLFDPESDALKLSDFGVALLLETCGKKLPGVTLREFYTRPFAAPEQILHGEASSAADLYAFGLLAASLLTWQIPPTEFKEADLPAFLSPLQTEILDPELFREVESCLASLLNSTPTLRFRTPDVRRLLMKLVERTAKKAVIPVIFTNSVRKKGSDCGYQTVGEMLADLNADLRARYEKDLQKDSFGIKCYGKSLWVHLVPSDDSPSRLLVVNIGQAEPSLHAHNRGYASFVPFALAGGEGNASPLIDLLYEGYRAEQRRAEQREQKESLLEVAKRILEMQRKRLQRLRVRYKVVDTPQKESSDICRKFDTMFGSPTGGGREEKVGKGRGNYLKLQVLKVGPIDEGCGGENGGLRDSLQAEDYEAVLADGLEKGVPFIYETQTFASFHAYDARSKTLTLRVDQQVNLDKEGDVECKDIAVEAVLKRQENALDRFFSGDTVNRRLGELLLHPERNELGDVVPLDLIQPLEPRDEMRSLVERVVAAQDFFLIQGPPGTGKTTVIAEVMAQILKRDPEARILLTSQANEAVNNAMEALGNLAKQAGLEWRLLRDVRSERTDRDVGYGVDAGFRDWLQSTRQSCEKALSACVETNGEAASEVVQSALRHWMERMSIQDDVRKDYAESVHVFGATCLRVPTLWKLLREVTFDWVIVDEAAKATPAEVLVSLVAGHRFVLVGDHHQLPPYLDNETERDLRESDIDPARARKSLFEEVFQRMPLANRTTLLRQYRMHRSIGSFVGELFYRDLGGLETGVADSDRALALSRFDRSHRVFWVDVHGKEEREGAGRRSCWNQRECDTIHKILKEVDRELQDRKEEYSVGIITPYAAQNQRLRRLLGGGLSNVRLQVDTVDAFQGKQCDLIIYSLVRVGGGQIPFVSDPRRLNVAFSRAKRLLLIVGHLKSALDSSQIAEAIRMIPQTNVITEELSHAR